MPKHPCPCCGCFTLDSRGEYALCPVCFWEDDPLQREDADRPGGANPVSLTEARNNYRSFGACQADMRSHVRSPRTEEIPE